MCQENVGQQLGNEFLLAENFLQSFEARLKIISVFFIIAVSVCLHSLFILSGLFIFAFVLNMWAQIPLSYIAKRLVEVIPFTLMSIIIFPFLVPGAAFWSVKLFGIQISTSYEGFKLGAMYTLRFGAAFLLTLFLTASMGLTCFLQALGALKVPRIFIQLTEFAIRYFYVLQAERQAMLTARKARNFKAKSIFKDKGTLTTLAQTIGMLFFRAYARAERIYFAMLARGYRGLMPVIKKQKVALKDILTAAFFIAFGVIILLADSGVKL